MRKSYKPRQQQPFFRINGQITAPTVRVLDDTGKQIGVLDRNEALRLAQEQEIDMVEIAPKARPPVVKLIDYTKFLYQQKKKKQEEKRGAKTGETKQIQFGPFIDDHDLEIKLKRGREFIGEGNKVRFVVKFRGRAITKTELGREVLNRVIEKMQDIAKVEREMRMEGRQMVLILSKGSNQVKEEVAGPNTTLNS